MNICYENTLVCLLVTSRNREQLTGEQRQIKKKHSKHTQQVTCGESVNVFPLKEGLNLDTDNTHKSKQPPPSCAKPVNYLWSHIEHAHSSTRKFTCEDCGKMFKTKSKEIKECQITNQSKENGEKSM